MKNGYNIIKCFNGMQYFKKDLDMESKFWMKDLTTPSERLNFKQQKKNKLLDCLIIMFIVGCFSFLNKIA